MFWSVSWLTSKVFIFLDPHFDIRQLGSLKIVFVNWRRPLLRWKILLQDYFVDLLKITSWNPSIIKVRYFYRFQVGFQFIQKQFLLFICNWLIFFWFDLKILKASPLRHSTKPVGKNQFSFNFQQKVNSKKLLLYPQSTINFQPLLEHFLNKRLQRFSLFPVIKKCFWEITM